MEDSLTVHAPIRALYDLTQDYYLRLEWDPFLKDLRFLDGAAAPAPGVRVWVRAKNGLAMTVEYVTVQPPERVAVKLVKGPFFFESFGGAWLLRDEGGGRTTVTFRYGFKTRWPLLRPLLDRAISLVFTRDIRARVRALRHAAEHTDLLQRAASPRLVPDPP